MQTYHPDPVGIPIPLAEFLLTDVLNRKDDRAGVWNDAKWQSIINTFHAVLQGFWGFCCDDGISPVCQSLSRHTHTPG